MCPFPPLVPFFLRANPSPGDRSRPPDAKPLRDAPFFPPPRRVPRGLLAARVVVGMHGREPLRRPRLDAGAYPDPCEVTRSPLEAPHPASPYSALPACRPESGAAGHEGPRPPVPGSRRGSRRPDGALLGGQLQLGRAGCCGGAESFCPPRMALHISRNVDAASIALATTWQSSMYTSIARGSSSPSRR